MRLPKRRNARLDPLKERPYSPKLPETRPQPGRIRTHTRAHTLAASHRDGSSLEQLVRIDQPTGVAVFALIVKPLPSPAPEVTTQVIPSFCEVQRNPSSSTIWPTFSVGVVES
jgi:hypothetical protein